MTVEDLDNKIKTIEKNTKVLKRLYFIRHRHDGYSVDKAAAQIIVYKMVEYQWQHRWNDSGYQGLIPRFAVSKPAKLSSENLNDLKEALKEKDGWTTEDVQHLIEKKFCVNFSLKHVRTILRKMRMHYAMPYQHDYRRRKEAKDVLKNLDHLDIENTIISFLDESSPQTTFNTVRMLSFLKPTKIKNTENFRASSFGFYSLNGNSIIEFRKHSRKKDIADFLELIRKKNEGKTIVIILDNLRFCKSYYVPRKADEVNIRLVFLPSYSPDLNPTEFLWKTMRRMVSKRFITSEEHFMSLIRKKFLDISLFNSYAIGWIRKFIPDEYNKFRKYGI